GRTPRSKTSRKSARSSILSGLTFSAPGELNYPLVYLVAAMLGFGLLMIYSASAVIVYYEGQSPFHFFFLQIIWIVVGSILAYIAYRIPLKTISSSSVVVMVITILMLMAVLVLGKDLN